MDFCVYETLYFGEKLPPRYIGSTTVKKVMSGYHGSVLSKEYKSTFRQELRDNPDLFYTVILKRCDTRKLAFKEENRLQLDRDAVNSPFYMNRTIVTPEGKYSNYGTKHTEDTKAKISAAHIGKRHTNETKDKLREHMIGKPAWNKGIPASEETKAKQRAAKLGKPLSPDHKDKIGKAHKGRVFSPETIAKMSAARTKYYLQRAANVN